MTTPIKQAVEALREKLDIRTWNEVHRSFDVVSSEEIEAVLKPYFEEAHKEGYDKCLQVNSKPIEETKFYGRQYQE